MWGAWRTSRGMRESEKGLDTWGTILGHKGSSWRDTALSRQETGRSGVLAILLHVGLLPGSMHVSVSGESQNFLNHNPHLNAHSNLRSTGLEGQRVGML